MLNWSLRLNYANVWHEDVVWCHKVTEFQTVRSVTCPRTDQERKQMKKTNMFPISDESSVVNGENTLQSCTTLLQICLFCRIIASTQVNKHYTNYSGLKLELCFSECTCKHLCNLQREECYVRSQWLPQGQAHLPNLNNYWPTAYFSCFWEAWPTQNLHLSWKKRPLCMLAYLQQAIEYYSLLFLVSSKQNLICNS